MSKKTSQAEVFERLSQYVHYDKETGIFRWKPRSPSDFAESKRWTKLTMCKRWNNRFAGKIAGGSDAYGYINLSFGSGVVCKAHRLAFFIINGWVPELVDHINCDPSDNRAVNLRAANKVLNAKNTKKPARAKSGHRGVYRSRDKWVAARFEKSKYIHIGSFDTIEDAIAARKQSEAENVTA